MKKKFEKVVKEEVEKPSLDSSVEVSEEAVQPESPYILVVKSPFGSYKKGDLIYDSCKINEILGNHQAHMVVKVIRKVG